MKNLVGTLTNVKTTQQESLLGSSTTSLAVNITFDLTQNDPRRPQRTNGSVSLFFRDQKKFNQTDLPSVGSTINIKVGSFLFLLKNYTVLLGPALAPHLSDLKFNDEPAGYIGRELANFSAK